MLSVVAFACEKTDNQSQKQQQQQQQRPNNNNNIKNEEDPQYEEEHYLSDIVQKIDKHTHGTFCYTHGRYENIEDHNFVVIDQSPVRFVYEVSANGYEINPGEYRKQCTECDYDELVARKAEDVLPLSADEKAEFAYNVSSYDYDSVRYIRGEYSGLLYKENGMWFTAAGRVSLSTMNYMNKLNRIFDAFVGEYEVYRGRIDYNDSEDSYLVKGYIETEYTNGEGQYELIPACLIVDSQYRPIIMIYKEGYSYSQGFSITYVNPTEEDELIEAQNLRNKVLSHLRANEYSVPTIQFDTSYSRSSLEYYSRTDTYKYYEKNISEGIKYFLQKGTYSTKGDTLYGIYDNGTVYYANVSEENDNEEYLRANKTTTTRDEFYSHVSLLTDAKATLNRLVSYPYYSYTDGSETTYWFVADDGFYKVVVKNGELRNLYYTTTDVTLQNRNNPHFYNTDDVFSYGYYYYENDEYFYDSEFVQPTYLYDAWHTHRYADSYHFNDEEHWKDVLCGHNDAVLREPHELVWTITQAPTPTTDGKMTGTCVCGYSEERAISKNDYGWTYAKSIDFSANGDGFEIGYVGQPKAGGDVITGNVSVVRGAEISVDDYLTAISSLAKPEYIAIMEIITDYDNHLHTNRQYNSTDADYDAVLAKYTVDSTLLNNLSDSGYTYNIYGVTPKDNTEAVVYYVITANGNGLEPLIIYVGLDGVATIYYENYSVVNGNVGGKLYLVYYAIDQNTTIGPKA